MSYLYATRTIRGAVIAKGADLYNAEGTKIACCTDSWMAAAMAMAINAGLPILKEREDHDDYTNKLRTDAMLASLKKEKKA